VGKIDKATALFVYGSLLDPSHREEILGRRVETAPATIRDYERGRERYYFIRKRVGIDTAGLILHGLTARDFAILDRYEEVPALYTRDEAEVIEAGGEAVRCFIYLPTPRLFNPQRE
jgi:gamma-glutamyl AIG2-like cyclotransferase